jgi:hypothetical protein
MSLDRVRLKIEILEELGLKADDRLESLTAETHRLEGAAKAFDTGRQKIETDVFARFKRDIDEGKVPQDPNEAVDRYLRTCIHYFQHLATQANAQIPVMKGRVQEATASVTRFKEQQNEEKLKIVAAESALAAGTVRKNEDGELEVVPQEGRPAPRPVGVHPGPSLKALRLAEEQAEAAVEPPVEPPVEVPVEPAAEAPPEPATDDAEPQDASPVAPEMFQAGSTRGRRRRVQNA